MTEGSVAGRTAIVTGASGSIGSRVAYGLAGQGARVVVNYHTRGDEAEQVVAGIRNAGGEAVALQGDVTSLASMEQLAEKTQAHYGTIDILVNNAGIVRDTLMLTMSDNDWDEVIDVNLAGPLNGCRAAVPYMKAQGYGRIVNIASITGLVAQKMRTNYGAAKRGAIGLTKCLARELAPHGILVNAVAPQVVKGGVSKSASPIELAQLAKFTPVGEVAEPDDVADSVLFLSRENMHFLTGAVINLTGGLITWQV